MINGGLTHLQYADDTLLMMGCDNELIRNMIFILYCFEWMSDLKINYHKSEVVVFGVEEERQQEIANMLNCKLGEFPWNYLGFPIRDKNLGVAHFSKIVKKMRKKSTLERKTSVFWGETGPN